mgnify:CR=1 FL=1
MSAFNSAADSLEQKEEQAQVIENPAKVCQNSLKQKEMIGEEFITEEGMEEERNTN